MTSPFRILPWILAPSLVILSGDAAFAQTIAPSGQVFPERIVNGQSLGVTTRPAPLTPLGVSYADCANDMTLRFSVALSGFTGNTSLQVWGSLGSDCTSATDRGIGTTSAKCWGLRAGNVTHPVINTPMTFSFDVRVQDLVGWQQALPTVAQAADPPAKGAEACTAQKTFAAVPINVMFLAVDDDGNAAGTSYAYPVPTDLVGPPAPTGVKLLDLGADLLQASWTANTDADTRGYDVYMAADAQTTCATSPLALLTHGAGDAGPGAAIPAQYLVASEGGAGVSVTDPAVTSFALGSAGPTQASALVAAVDAFGNVGPASALACEELAPDSGAQSFGGGGSGGGGGCSAGGTAPVGRDVLETGALLAALAIVRRLTKRSLRLAT